MNKSFKWSIALLSMMVMGCSDDEILKNPVGDPAYSGDEVVFTFVNQDNKSRTTYAEPWAEEESQNIYWGNYIADQVEQIKIYCRESDGNMAVYNVNPSTNPGSSTAISIGKADENTSIRWGAQYTDRNYEFYSFYPAASAGNAFVGNEGHVIQASVETGQVPRAYKYKVGNGELAAATLDDIAKASGMEATKRATIFAMPDMESAIMTAHTTVAGTPDKENGTGYGYPVPLDFKVIADVLDITVNGPISPNTLGSNGNPDGTGSSPQNYIKIRSITIVSKSKSILSGKFTIDMDNGKVTPIEGNSRILVTTSDEGQYPTLHVRSTDSKTVDQLRVRVFLMPGQVTDLSDLTVTVGTDCGDYTVDLQAHEMVSGAIHPIKLNYFKKRGDQFNFAQWIGQLDPNIYLSELSIPGTWHSSNTNNQGNVTLKQQYEAGIRAFEVHTVNGTELKKYGDVNTAFDSETADYEPEHLSSKTSDKGTASGGENFEVVSQSWTNRTIKADNLTVTITRTETFQQKPKYSLRLYRTRNVATATSNPKESFSDALIELAEQMNTTGFMFFEFGWDWANKTDRSITVPYKSVTQTQTVTLTGVSLTGTQTRGWAGFPDLTAEDTTWDYSSIDLTNANWSEPNVTSVNYQSTYTLNSMQAWGIAVESCINRLSNTINSTTGKQMLHTEAITPNTTISDVQGQVIVKINTNEDDNESFGWSGYTPALFSRWVGGSATEPRTINLKWGAPVNPSPLNEDPYALHWCYSELEQVSDTIARKAALPLFSNLSFKNYSEGLHRTFYECAIGGYYTGDGNNTKGCQTLAKVLNPALLNVLTDPARKPCPFGIVFMNYAIAPDGQESLYKSAELISTIINNNAAFMLQRRSDTSSANAADKTNSSFSANNGNPLK